jgi:hypothetical protein
MGTEAWGKQEEPGFYTSKPLYSFRCAMHVTSGKTHCTNLDTYWAKRMEIIIFVFCYVPTKTITTADGYEGR